MTATSDTPSDASTTSAPRKYNLRNPLPLSATQEAEVKQIYYKRVRSHCAAEIKAFAECAVNRTVTATWVCRSQRLAMNSCMVAHAKPEEEDRAREEWFATHEERRRQREEELIRVEQRRAEVIRLMREDEARRARQG
ncbi:cytochrome c oxidase biogenesis protein Cmc1 like-domain-containing protein [Aspergillus floccosus]